MPSGWEKGRNGDRMLSSWDELAVCKLGSLPVIGEGAVPKVTGVMAFPSFLIDCE